MIEEIVITDESVEVITADKKKRKKKDRTGLISFGLKGEILPDASQKSVLSMHFGCARFVFNKCIATQFNNYNVRNIEGVSKTYMDKGKMQTFIKDLKKGFVSAYDKDCSFLSQTIAQASQCAIADADVAMTRYMKGISGKPKFKKKTDRHDSFTFSQGFYINDNKLYIPKLKTGIKLSKKFVEYLEKVDSAMRFTAITISRTPSGKYYASFRVEMKECDFKQFAPACGITAIDLGLKDVMVDDKGNKVKALKAIKKVEKKIRKLNKGLARKRKVQNKKIAEIVKKYNKSNDEKLATNKELLSAKKLVEIKTLNYFKNTDLQSVVVSFEVIKWNKTSKRYEKERIKLAKCHQKSTNQRRDFSHQLTTKIVKENQVVIIEDLAVANMMKNKKLSKSFMEVSLGEVIRQFEYKCKWHGREFYQVSRTFPSSKRCSCCGKINDNLKLKHRTWTCESCGTIHDRDVNAAINIKLEGLRLLAQSDPLLSDYYNSLLMAAGNPKDGLLGINDMEQFANFASSHFREMQKNSRSVNAQLCEEIDINNILSTQS